MKYTECLNQIPDKRSPLAINCYSNRSACYKQLSNFDATVEDTTAVLEVEPSNVKALVRRAQAFEAIERCEGGCMYCGRGMFCVQNSHLNHKSNFQRGGCFEPWSGVWFGKLPASMFHRSGVPPAKCGCMAPALVSIDVFPPTS